MGDIHTRAKTGGCVHTDKDVDRGGVKQKRLIPFHSSLPFSSVHTKLRNGLYSMRYNKHKILSLLLKRVFRKPMSVI